MTVSDFIMRKNNESPGNKNRNLKSAFLHCLLSVLLIHSCQTARTVRVASVNVETKCFQTQRPGVSLQVGMNNSCYCDAGLHLCVKFQLEVWCQIAGFSGTATFFCSKTISDGILDIKGDPSIR